MKLDEPTADLGIALAVVSSNKNIPLPKDLIAMGEIGLTGEVRGISSIEKRIKEAEKLGIKICIVPEISCKQLKYKGKINIIGVTNVAEAIKICTMK